MIKEMAFSIYAVTDMPRARKFYEGVLGLEPGAEYDGSKNPNWIEYPVGSGTFAIGSSPDWQPSELGTSVAFEVDDFDAEIAKLKAAGVVFKMEPQNFPGCSMAVVYDPDKNIVIIHRRKDH